MPSFKKKRYTEPIICRHNNDLSKDWYVFFRFKNESKVHKYKRREGINRISDLNTRLTAIEELRKELSFDLKNGWNPIADPKRELNYNPYFYKGTGIKKPVEKKVITKMKTKEELYAHFFNKPR